MADNRDDFLAPVRRAVALRAGYQCSFTDCSVVTVGPSDESELSYSQVGVAAHIHAAARGGARFLEAMTQEQRRHIDNAIWMCRTHGTLIDEDEVTYTPDKLRSMKRAHEQAIARRMATNASGIPASDLIALGPDLIFVGSVVGSSGSKWTLRIDHFIQGDLSNLVAFGERFEGLPRQDRFVLVASFGDGRVVASAPAWRRDNGILVDLSVEPPFPRIRAHDLGEDLKIDLVKEDLTSTMATVSGLEMLPQRIHVCLWHQKGQFPWEPNFGTRLAEFYSLFHGSAWLQRLVKLEAIRMAAIPFPQDFGNETTPFECVERVCHVELLAEEALEGRLSIRLELDVVGIGRRTTEVRLHVPEFPFPAPPEMPSAADMAAKMWEP